MSSVTEEKKSLKRTFQQIQEEEDDDYPGSYSPQDPSAGPLLVCGMGWAWEELWRPQGHLPCVTATSPVSLPQGGADNKWNGFSGEIQFGFEKSVQNATDSFFLLQ